ncbi:lysophospholipase L1-like esterase [Aequorivita sublithincola DSM 14238]|uniref:Lysophospholipase L1-like esterase n=1 Tax=Aequorivita sublithincola (strain DSM 14238 / LMG 21431 / ACAM 643 / 9-3) TaxID=746697 RepID=I3YVQ5_AEQSU|nr:SGNH/GDSL hydrolase family protein [Aequorivita sublithincola]AFL81073.1 lysophospholipase L1-like esterase [Aequorivita sublithincola DSM 14238]
MMNFKIVIVLAFFQISCGVSKKNTSAEKTTNKYLALGDSYTIGESVCSDCNYPKHLTESLNEVLKEKTSVKIIAKTGWTTTDLLSAIAAENPSKDYDLVTLLIGVNNQYQEKPFSLYEEEFPKLLDMAIAFAKGKAENVIVLSIPDYAFTPFGQKSGKAEKITSELKKYDAFAAKISKEKGVRFENITPITQKGLENADLVASDGLHPSEVAYKKFVEQILSFAKNILK